MSAILHPTTIGAAADGIGNQAGGMVFHVLWGTFKSTLGIVGLTPLYLAYIIATILVVAIGAQIRGAISGHKSWTLDNDGGG